MKTLRLKTVDAYIAFDFECPTSAGGTRLAPDVTERETQLLARAMSYKFAVLETKFGGAKGAIRATPATRDDAIRHYVDEIRPMVLATKFLTSTDLGTMPEDLKSLPGTDQADLMHTEYRGMPLDAYLTGLGVATAAETVLGGLEGRTAAIEGFGKVGGATAVEMARRGARLVAFSTIHGFVQRPSGFDVKELLHLRSQYGDRLIEHLAEEVQPVAGLFLVEADVLVPGARIGVIDESRARALKARVVAPGANVPYTAGALEVLRERGIPALADFVCNSGATIGYVTDGLLRADEAVAAVEKRVRELTKESVTDPNGPHAGAARIAEAHLRTWLEPAQMPDGPALA
ncbi:MAG: Glu/Leu/Phe/Val dehydrogenase [Chloroflexi bacterium]|nr:MAG: Glu/Leu/Phe/Val dehydrogenase [Chloroflexota bacterium]